MPSGITFGSTATIPQLVGSPVRRAESLSCLCAAMVGTVPLTETLTELEALTPGLHNGPHALVAEVFARCVAGDVDGARQARERLRRADGPPTAYGYWWAITGWWIASVDPSADPDEDGAVEWIHGAEDARSRWVDVLQVRRAAV